MKIPQILAQEPVAIPRMPRAPEGNGRGAAALATGLGAVAQSLATIAEAQEAKQQLAARSEAALKKSEFDRGLADLDSELRLTQSDDPDAYLAASKKGTQALQASILAGTRSAEAKTLLQGALAQAAATHYAKSRTYYNQVFISRAEGQLEGTLDNNKILVGTATTDEQRAQLYGAGVGAIENLRPLMGDKQIQARKIKWRDDFLMDVEGRKIDADPGTWTPQAVKNVLPDDKIKILEERADRLQRRQQADAERRDKEAERMLTVAKKQLVTDLEADAASGTLTLETLDLRREMRQLDPGDYRRLRKDIAEGGIQRPSDPAVMSGIGLDVAAMRPRTTEADINRLHEAYLNGRPGLNLKDAQTLKEKLTTKLRVLENEGESDLVRDHNQAEQMIRAALGIRPGLIVEALKDDPAGRLYFSGVDELSRRSRLFRPSYGGTEDPLTVAAELIPRLQKAFGQASQPRLNELTGLLRYPTPQALEQAFQSGQISEPSYRLEKQRFLDLNRLRQRIAPPAEGPAKPKEAKPRL